MLLHKLGVALMISVRFFNLESVLIFPSTRANKVRGEIFMHAENGLQNAILDGQRVFLGYKMVQKVVFLLVIPRRVTSSGFFVRFINLKNHEVFGRNVNKMKCLQILLPALKS